jgi:NADH:ubiquinone oxidoreductase subunit E
MGPPHTIYLCLGSACHQSRGYRLLPLLEDLLRRHGLGGRLQLKGAFCLENCQHACSLKFAGRVFTGVNEHNLTGLFEREILPHCLTH